MSIEALWIARFTDTSMPQLIPGFSNAGVVVLESGRLFGGDAQYYYVGHYELKDKTITAKVRATHFNGPMLDVFGGSRKSLDVVMVGKWRGELISGYIQEAGKDNTRLTIILERKESLP